MGEWETIGYDSLFTKKSYVLFLYFFEIDDIEDI